MLPLLKQQEKNWIIQYNVAKLSYFCFQRKTAAAFYTQVSMWLFPSVEILDFDFIFITCLIVALWGRPLGTSLPSWRAVEKRDRGRSPCDESVESGKWNSWLLVEEVKWSEIHSVMSDSASPIHSMEFSRLEQSCRVIFYQLNHKGSPRILEWVPIPSPVALPDPESNQGLLDCGWILYQLSYWGGSV